MECGCNEIIGDMKEIKVDWKTQSNAFHTYRFNEHPLRQM